LRATERLNYKDKLKSWQRKFIIAHRKRENVGCKIVAQVAQLNGGGVEAKELIKRIANYFDLIFQFIFLFFLRRRLNDAAIRLFSSSFSSTNK
jgi:hypothetical protein